MKRMALAALLLSGLFLGAALAQDQQELDRFEEKFSHHLENKMPGWKHERGEPIQGSKGVLIEFWSSLGKNRRIKISLSLSQSASEARRSIREFLKYNSERQELKGIGDEAYSWGYAEGDIVLARGRFIVHVSTVAHVEDDPDAYLLNSSERAERKRSEMKRLNREFAQQMVNAIDGP